jgi:formate hydrogenlyase subunit 4
MKKAKSPPLEGQPVAAASRWGCAMTERIVYNVLQATFVLGVAPLVEVVVNRLKEILQSKQGPGLLQPYRDIWKLLHKDEIVSDESSWIFRAAPYVAFAAPVFVALLIPVFTRYPLFFAFMGDMLGGGFVLALGGFFATLAAVDTANPYGPMGASRTRMVGFLAEPVFIVVFLTVSFVAGSTIPYIVQTRWVTPIANFFAPSHVLLMIAFLMLILAEDGRIPVDSPSGAFELAMIDRSKGLEYSGRGAALIKWAGAMKLLVLVLIFLNVLVTPWGLAQRMAPGEVLLAIPLVLLKVLGFILVLVYIESSLAKLRLFRITEFSWRRLRDLRRSHAHKAVRRPGEVDERYSLPGHLGSRCPGGRLVPPDGAWHGRDAPGARIPTTLHLAVAASHAIRLASWDRLGVGSPVCRRRDHDRHQDAHDPLAAPAHGPCRGVPGARDQAGAQHPDLAPDVRGFDRPGLRDCHAARFAMRARRCRHQSAWWRLVRAPLVEVSSGRASPLQVALKRSFRSISWCRDARRRHWRSSMPDGEQRHQSVDAGRRHQADFGQMRAKGIDQLCSLPDEKIARAVQHKRGLLLSTLDRHEAHARPCHGLANGRCIGCIVLLPPDIRLHIARWHQSHNVAPSLVNSRAQW